MFKFLVIVVFVFSFSFSSNDNLYSLISNPRNISIGKIHASIDNISNTFDSPILLNNNSNIYLSIDRYANLYSIYYLSFILLLAVSMHIGQGLLGMWSPIVASTQKIVVYLNVSWYLLISKKIID